MFNILRPMVNTEKGAATLPVVLLVGGLVVEIGIAGAFIAYFLSQSGFGLKLSAEALAAAMSGIQDAKMKIVRNKNFIPSPNPYTLTIGNNSAQITVCKDLKTVSTACDTAMNGKFEITSLGTAFTKYRQVRAILYVDGVTGEVKLESEKEISL
jgi:uncharacterized protein (UPF0333 family)